jgi:CsoR family transcriptional regulator, copper-sensing transcriptional repressor
MNEPDHSTAPDDERPATDASQGGVEQGAGSEHDDPRDRVEQGAGSEHDDHRDRVEHAEDRAADEPTTDRADRLADRIAVPVLIAALASVPAVFMTFFDDPWETFGEGLNTLSGTVLIAETVVLFAVSQDRIAWIKRNKWLVLLALAIIPAIVFAVGPVQLLRLVRIAGALRIIRVGRIIKAGRLVRERAGLTEGWQRAIGIAATLLCAAFVALVLADPSSATRELLDGAVDLVGWIGVVVAGLILAGATYVVYVFGRDEDRKDSATANEATAGAAGADAAGKGETTEPRRRGADPTTAHRGAEHD